MHAWEFVLQLLVRLALAFQLSEPPSFSVAGLSRQRVASAMLVAGSDGPLPSMNPFEAMEIGAPGRAAVLIVINQNLLEIAGEEIAEARVLLTQLAGRPVHTSNAFPWPKWWR